MQLFPIELSLNIGPGRNMVVSSVWLAHFKEVTVSCSDVLVLS